MTVEGSMEAGLVLLPTVEVTWEATLATNEGLASARSTLVAAVTAVSVLAPSPEFLIQLAFS